MKEKIKEKMKDQEKVTKDRYMKRDERKYDFVENCLRSKSARWIGPKCFKSKSLSNELFLLFLRKFSILRCFRLFT